MDNRCKECGGRCCQFFGLSDDVDDTDWLIARADRHFEYGDHNVVTFDYPCPKLDVLGRCEIYERRPEQCKSLVVGSSGCRFAIRYTGGREFEILVKAAHKEKEKGDQDSHLFPPP